MNIILLSLVLTSSSVELTPPVSAVGLITQADSALHLRDSVDALEGLRHRKTAGLVTMGAAVAAPLVYLSSVELFAALIGISVGAFIGEPFAGLAGGLRVGFEFLFAASGFLPVTVIIFGAAAIAGIVGLVLYASVAITHPRLAEEIASARSRASLSLAPVPAGATILNF